MTDERADTIAKTAKEIKFLVAAYLEEGISPGVIAGALIENTIDLMRVQDMSKMQISNELYALVDGIRDQAFKL